MKKLLILFGSGFRENDIKLVKDKIRFLGLEDQIEFLGDGTRTLKEIETEDLPKLKKDGIIGSKTLCTVLAHSTNNLNSEGKSPHFIGRNTGQFFTQLRYEYDIENAIFFSCFGGAILKNDEVGGMNLLTVASSKYISILEQNLQSILDIIDLISHNRTSNQIFSAIARTNPESMRFLDKESKKIHELPSALKELKETKISGEVEKYIEKYLEKRAKKVFGDVELVKYQENKNNNLTKNTLLQALFRGEKFNNVVLEIIEHNPEFLNTQDEYGMTILVHAVKQGNLELVQELLAKKASLNLKRNDKKNILMFAAEAGNADIVRLLIANGVGLKDSTKSGDTAISMAITKGYDEVADIIEKAIEEFNNKSKEEGEKQAEKNREIFINAAKKGYVAQMEDLIVEKNVDINSQNKDGETALMGVIYGDHIKVAKRLIRNEDVNLDLQTTAGYTALMFAAEKGNEELVKLLIEKGADLSLTTKDDGHYSARFIAEISGHENIVKIIDHAMEAMGLLEDKKEFKTKEKTPTSSPSSTKKSNPKTNPKSPKSPTKDRNDENENQNSGTFEF